MSLDKRLTLEICKQLKNYLRRRNKLFLFQLILMICFCFLNTNLSPGMTPLFIKTSIGTIIVLFIISIFLRISLKLNLDLSDHSIMFQVNKNLFNSKIAQYLLLLKYISILFIFLSILFYTHNPVLSLALTQAFISIGLIFILLAFPFYLNTYPIYLTSKSDFLVLSQETEQLYSSKAELLFSFKDLLDSTHPQKADIVADLSIYGYSTYEADDEDGTTMTEVMILKDHKVDNRLYLAPHDIIYNH